MKTNGAWDNEVEKAFLLWNLGYIVVDYGTSFWQLKSDQDGLLEAK